MDHEPTPYQPINVPTSGPSAYQPPNPNEIKPTNTSTDRHLRRIYTKPWLWTIISLIMVIGLLYGYYLLTIK
jgi:hypothetical protein